VNRTAPLLLLLVLAAAGAAGAAELPDLRSIAPDLATPVMTDTAPAAGRRVRETVAGYDARAVYHALYLPTDWQPGKQFPVIFEYAGNGGFSNRFGDVCTGRPEGCNLGYGVGGGSNFIWVCLPYIAVTNGQMQLALQWWGDVDETLRYAKLAVRHIAERYGGDTNALFLAGFSRGAIAGNFLGLHDDTIARLWRGFICHSHYDGVRAWPYAGSDRAAAQERLRRLGNRPQWISHEGSVEATRAYLAATGVSGAFTLVPLPYRNHTDEWVLRPLPERERLRAWLWRVLGE
jgi:acetyl esterase/lipase